MIYQAITNRTILELVNEKPSSTLHIPDTVQRPSIIGRVLSTTHPDLKEGELVAFSQMNAHIADAGDKKIVFIPNDSILAKAVRE